MAFTIGPDGYEMTAVKLAFNNSAQQTDVHVELWSANGSAPGARITRLRNPGNLTSAGIKTFSAPADTILSADTTYFIVAFLTTPLNFPAVQLSNSDAEDVASLSGWSIGDQGYVRSGGSWTATDRTMKVAVEGSVVASPDEIWSDILTAAVLPEPDEIGYSRTGEGGGAGGGRLTDKTFVHGGDTYTIAGLAVRVATNGGFIMFCPDRLIDTAVVLTLHVDGAEYPLAWMGHNSMWNSQGEVCYSTDFRGTTWTAGSTHAIRLTSTGEVAPTQPAPTGQVVWSGRVTVGQDDCTYVDENCSQVGYRAGSSDHAFGSFLAGTSSTFTYAGTQFTIKRFATRAISGRVYGADLYLTLDRWGLPFTYLNFEFNADGRDKSWSYPLVDGLTNAIGHHRWLWKLRTKGAPLMTDGAVYDVRIVERAPFAPNGLVGNVHQYSGTYGSDWRSHGNIIRQHFTTGPNAPGYRLDSIALPHLRASGPVEISLWRTDHDGQRGPTPTFLGTLGSVASLLAYFNPPDGVINSTMKAGKLTYALPSPVTLAANTEYQILIEPHSDSGVSVPVTVSRADDAASASGWSIADSGFSFGLVTVQKYGPLVDFYGKPILDNSNDPVSGYYDFEYWGWRPSVYLLAFQLSGETLEATGQQGALLPEVTLSAEATEQLC